MAPRRFPRGGLVIPEEPSAAGDPGSRGVGGTGRAGEADIGRAGDAGGLHHMLGQALGRVGHVDSPGQGR